MATPAEISLEDIASHCKVETSCLDEVVTSAYYHKVSRYLSKWKLIAPKLKFTDDEVESIDQDNVPHHRDEEGVLSEGMEAEVCHEGHLQSIDGVPPGYREGGGCHECVSGLEG